MLVSIIEIINIVAYLGHVRIITSKHAPAITQ
jgi:hypothetical protein